MNHRTFVINAYNWGLERDLYIESDSPSQALKYIEEVGELAAGICRNNKDTIADALADIIVCTTVQMGFSSDYAVIKFSEMGLEPSKETVGANLRTLSYQFAVNSYDPVDIYKAVIGIAKNYGIDMEKAYEDTWNEIKDRKGKFVSGVFIKEADLG